MRNDLQRLVIVPDYPPYIVLEPDDAVGLAILARIIRDAEHNGWDENAHEPIDLEALEASREHGLYE